MSCVSADSLQRFVDGALAPERLAEVEQHLDGCESCRALLAASASASFEAGGAGTGEADLKKLGRYLLEKPLGAGGMGVVYAAHDPQLQRPVAIKLLHEGASIPVDTLNPSQARLESEDKLRDQLLREARAMARLSHPNVLPIFEVGESGGRIFLAMELAENGSLADWLAAKPRSLAEKLALFIGAGRGLAAAHAAGLVHRDFKPANVLLGAQSRPMVTDFGLARPLYIDPDINNIIYNAYNIEKNIEAEPAPIAAAQQSAAAGSLAYMAPEQLRGEPIGPRADLFSFSVALYEALYGERPFEGKSAAELLQAISSGRIRPAPKSSASNITSNLSNIGGPTELAASRVPAALRRVLLRGLHADPRERFASMDELLAALERSRRLPRRRAVYTAVILSGLFAAALVLFLFAQERRLNSLVEEKRGLDASISSVLAQLAGERDPERLAQLDLQLQSLTGSAESASRKLGDRSFPEEKEAPIQVLNGGAPLASEELDRQLQSLLARFGAATYVIPPQFKERVRTHLIKILANPNLGEQWARKNLYWAQMTPPFRSYGLPEELAYLAFAESRFDPEARSPTGATGMWQFMPQSAKRLGLVIEGARDDRTDIARSSEAAAHYLAELMTELGSDSFLLAIASYNVGENQMREALAVLAREPGAFRKDRRDFWHLYLRKLLPEETREYVPEVLAAILLGANAHRYGLE